MDLLTKVLPLSFSANLGQNSILFHNSQYCFGVVIAPLALEPYVHSAVAVSLMTLGLLFFDHICQRRTLPDSSNLCYI